MIREPRQKQGIGGRSVKRRSLARRMAGCLALAAPAGGPTAGPLWAPLPLRARRCAHGRPDPVAPAHPRPTAPTWRHATAGASPPVARRTRPARPWSGWPPPRSIRPRDPRTPRTCVRHRGRRRRTRPSRKVLRLEPDLPPTRRSHRTIREPARDTSRAGKGAFHPWRPPSGAARCPWSCVLAISSVGPAALRAQDKPIDLGGSGQSVEDLTGENGRPLQVTGFGVGDYSYDQRTGDNSARAGKLALALFREVNDRVWFFGQLTTALVTGEEAAAGGDEVPTEIEIDNLLMNFTPGGASGLSLAFGKFDVPLGFERDDEPLNLQATNSFNFELARPAKMVGLVGRWALSPRVDLTAMAGNGWDAQVDPNHGKTGGARLGLLPTEHTSLGPGRPLGRRRRAGRSPRPLSADRRLRGGARRLGRRRRGQPGRRAPAHWRTAATPGGTARPCRSFAV